MTGSNFGKPKSNRASQGPWETFRWGIFLIAISATIAWAIHSYKGQSGQGSARERQARQIIDQVTSRIAKSDLNVAEEIRAASKSRSGSQEGLALALLFQENVGKGRGVPDLADQLKQGSPLVELLDLAVDKSDFPDEESRNKFLMAQGAILAVCGDNEILTDRTQAQNAVRQHMQRIERARKSPDWAILKYDALSVWILDGVKNQELRSFYLDNREWLGETLAEFRMKDAKGDPGSPKTGDWEDLIEVARKYYPLTREAVTGTRTGEIATEGERGGSEGLAMFIDHGEVIKGCAENGLPVLETVAVLFANPGWNEKASASQKIQRLVEIHRNRKSVWAMAMAGPQVLVLDEKVPQYSGKLIEDFGHDDIASLILNVCEGFEEPAAHAVVKYGDIAIFAIKKYGQIDQFKAGMLKPGGFRAPAYLLIKGDSGLNLVGNQANLDKEFDSKGDPVGGWGWKDVPILGGPINIARNWANGADTEWGELGWAALDVLDGALLVATLGTSAEVTAGKQAAKASAKKIALEGAEVAAKSAAKGAREAAKKAFRNAPALGFKGGMLARLGRTGEFMGSVAAKLARMSSLTYNGAKYVIGGMTKVITGAFRAAKGSFAALPPAARKTIYRALLVVSLGYSISERTFPAIKEMIKGGGEWLVDTFAEPIKVFVDGVKRGFEALAPQIGFFMGGFLNLVVLLLLAFASFRLFPGRAVLSRA